MHLTFVNSEGLEYSAVSFIESEKMTLHHQDYNHEDSETESEFLVVDENSPLLVDLDPPGTRTHLPGLGRRRKKTLLNFRIKRVTGGLPWVIVFTSLGMAAMVLIGFITMFQDNATIIGNNTIVDVDDPASGGLMILQLDQMYANATNNNSSLTP